MTGSAFKRGNWVVGGCSPIRQKNLIKLLGIRNKVLGEKRGRESVL
jgi:hypothetical protein